MVASLLVPKITQRISTQHALIERRGKDIVKQGSSVRSGLGHGREPRDAAGIRKALDEILVASLGTA